MNHAGADTSRRSFTEEAARIREVIERKLLVDLPAELALKHGIAEAERVRAILKPEIEAVLIDLESGARRCDQQPNL